MSKHFKRFLYNDTYFYTVLLLLIAVTSFGLGRLSLSESIEAAPAAVVMTQEPAPGANDDALALPLVASKNGTKYHAQWCPGASQIKEANKITFSSEQEAQASGYTLAANCKM